MSCRFFTLFSCSFFCFYYEDRIFCRNGGGLRTAVWEIMDSILWKMTERERIFDILLTKTGGVVIIASRYLITS